MCIIAGILNDDKKGNPEETATKEENIAIQKANKSKLDAILKDIKNDKEAGVLSVKYMPDQTIKITVKNRSKLSATYFNTMYNYDTLSIISEIEVYKNGRLKSSEGKRTWAKTERFEKEYISSWDGSCRILEKYIKSTMNDPGSYEHVRTFYNLQSDGTFRLKTIFSGKNAFGGRVQNEIYAIMDGNGNILSTE